MAPRHDMIHMKVVSKIEKVVEERESRESAFVAVFDIGKVFQFLNMESKRFTPSGHRRFQLIQRKSCLAVLANGRTQGGEKRVRTCPPDTTFE